MPLMRWRPGHLALILFQAFWLNVVIPGHTRGAVALPGCDGGSCIDSSVSAARPASCCHTGESSRSKSFPSRSSRCAICAFAARMTLPPVVDFAPPKLGLLAWASTEPAHEALSLAPAAAYDGRAPPTCI